ncbi:uncharacterized protein N7511_010302 [Penicillium nucicola]|uniref:uncharacterized protein n=1 Tax=Penicillium nucicola TaxID=1850975 RepID=UPI002544E189|nr:uncharacterized protein N7511_010302 [Penicillium nucicola]KAJ5748606.1 hypothetical protein N7511_010302 [Penicillium nucicola]
MNANMAIPMSITGSGTEQSMDEGLRRPFSNSRACRMCHRKKTKCEIDGSARACLQCRRSSTRCVFPEVGENLESDEYVQSLKERIVRVEALLKTAGILHEGDMSPDDFSDEDEDDEPPSQDISSTPSPTMSSLCRKGAGLEVTSIFRADERDDSRYFGKSCSMSILSRTGIEWIKSKTGDVSFLRLVSPEQIHDNPWNHWRPDVFQDLFASQVFKPLPSRSEVFSLMKDFFQTANRLFPIYLESKFMKMVEWQYTQQTCDDAARWASINMVIGLAYEYRFSNSSKPEKDRERAREYFKNAMSVFTELALKRTDLLSVQALLSMAFFLRGNCGTQSALPLVTAAMRSGQRMGLHRDIPRPDLSPAEQEERRRVFWVAFVVDQSTCLRIGNAPSQHPDDFDVPLPTELESDKESASNIPFFRQLCRMSIIKGRIYSRLYSAKALLRPPLEIYRTVKELHKELENWKGEYPLTTEPKLKPGAPDFLLGFAAAGLHFVYYNALIMIHRIPLFLHYIITSKATSKDLKELEALSIRRASKSASIGAQAARDTLKLINNMPWGDIAWTWSLLYYVFLGAATIFSSILRDLRHPKVRADLQSLTMASTFFATLVPGDGASNYAGFMARMSATLERIARVAVEKEEKREKEEPHLSANKKRTNSSSHKRRQPTTLRNAMTTDTTDQSTSDRENMNTNTNTNMNMAMDIGIPDTLEGLPPVNSSGYVVPLSPDTRTPQSHFQLQQQHHHPSNQPPNPYTNEYLDRTFLHEAGATGNHYTNPPMTMPSWQLSQDFSATAEPPTGPVLTTLDTNSPSSFASSTPTGTTNSTIPEFFQVPMTGDWDYSGSLFAGLFPAGFGFPVDGQATGAGPGGGVGADPAMSILSAESYVHGAPAVDGRVGMDGNGGFDAQGLGYGYGFVPESQGQGQGQGQGQAEDTVWPNGFLGLF